MTISYPAPKALASNIKTYAPNEQSILAILVTRATADEAARWCGGDVRQEAKPSDPDDVYFYVRVPTLNGILKAGAGTYVVRQGDGRFAIMDETTLKAKYHEVGLRQDGFKVPRGGIIQNPDTGLLGQMESMGH